MTRSADNPFAVLVMGLLGLAALGGLAIWFSETKPVLKLEPALEKHYGEEGFRARFVPGKLGNPAAIEVEVPGALADRRLEIGIHALREYRKLAQPSVVERCEVVVAGQPKALPVAIDLAVVRGLDGSVAFCSKHLALLRGVGIEGITLNVDGMAGSGLLLRASGRSPDHKAAVKLAGTLVTFLGRAKGVALVEVRVATPKGEVVRSGGREASAGASSRGKAGK